MKQSYIKIIIGLALLAGCVLFVTLIKCLNNAQYFVLYMFSGLSIAHLFSKSAEKSEASIKFYNGTVYIFGGVIIPILLVIKNPIKNYKDDECFMKLKRVSATVYLYGSKGHQDLVLRNQGTVIMDLENGRLEEKIGDKGEAVFTNLQIDQKVKIGILFSEPYEPAVADSTYIINVDGRIDVQLVLKGNNKVTGNTFYNKMPISGVNVRIGSLRAISDSMGYFIVDIPKEDRKDEYDVLFSKDGFESQRQPAYPQTGKPLYINMIKNR